MKKKKSVSEIFCDALYQVLAFGCRKILDEDLNFKKDEFFSYSEVFEHFDYVMLQLEPFKQMMDYYDDIDTDLIGFAITHNINDFKIKGLNDETLRMLKIKIDNEIIDRKLFEEKSGVTVKCDDCESLGNNGICNYCTKTMECYDDEEDLIDGVLPNCPKKLYTPSKSSYRLVGDGIKK